MTTFAYSKKEGKIAIDGRVSSGSRICSDKDEKYVKCGGNIYFTIGGVADTNRLIKLVEDGHEEAGIENIFDCYIVLAQDPPKEIYVNENGFIEMVSMTEDFSALGSGGDYALAALDMGKTAKQAVEYAATRDIYTGGKVRVYDIKKGKFINV